jgi:hypothetical protein
MVPPFVIILPHTCNESLMYGSKRLNVPESSIVQISDFALKCLQHMAWSLKFEPLNGILKPVHGGSCLCQAILITLIYSNSQILCRTSARFNDLDLGEPIKP